MTDPRATQVSVDSTGLGTVTGSDVQSAIEQLDAAVGGAGYTDEQARDAIGTALVGGSGISITVNDPSDTITIASTAGSGFNPAPVDDPANYGTDLGYDYEFGATGSSLPSGWSWVNQGSATYTEAFGAGVIDHPGQAGDNIKGLVQAIPGSSSFTATIKCLTTGTDNDYFIGGFLLYDSASTKLLIVGYASGRRFLGDQYTNPTTWNANRVTTNAIVMEPHYQRLVKNSSTSWDFLASTDGIAWRMIQAGMNLSTFFTPDKIGFGLNQNGAREGLVACHWFRIR